MADLSSVIEQAKESNGALQVFLLQNKERRLQQQRLTGRLQELYDKVETTNVELDLHLRTIQLIGSVSDKTIDTTLHQIEAVINKSLSILFPAEKQEIHLSKYMYREQHLHYEVELETSGGSKVDFTMSGTGLAQVVSFLFLVTFIDIVKARRFVVMDEILNGLHPEAKKLVGEIMSALAPRFQFLIVEHHMDVGKQYVVEKMGVSSKVKEYEGIEAYFTDFYRHGVKQALKNVDALEEQTEILG